VWNYIVAIGTKVQRRRSRGHDPTRQCGLYLRLIELNRYIAIIRHFDFSIPPLQPAEPPAGPASRSLRSASPGWSRSGPGTASRSATARSRRGTGDHKPARPSTLLCANPTRPRFPVGSRAISCPHPFAALELWAIAARALTDMSLFGTE